jgi:hypothetical protein
MLLADRSDSSGSEQSPAAGRPPAPGGAPGAPEQSSSAGPAGATCRHCGQPLGEGQQWCLQCGAGQPASLGGGAPGWRPLSVLALTAAILVAGAAVAGAAALKGGGGTATVPATTPTVVAQAPATTVPPTTTAPATPGVATTPTAPTGKSPKGPHKGGSSGNFLFPGSGGKPPKIPHSSSTPKPSGSTTGQAQGAGEGKSTTTPGAGESGEGTSTNESEAPATSEKPTPLLLDTDAASTYNPYNYPEAGFGDPSLAIDGENSTAWNAAVQPSSAPNMAEGLLIDMNTPTKVGSIALRTPTPGMTIQIYGANGHKAPATITEPGWTQLRSTQVLAKSFTHFKLRTGGEPFRYVLVWLTKAPASAVGTPQSPGHVSLSQVELFPPGA